MPTKQEEIRERMDGYAELHEDPTGDADEDYVDLCRELTALGVVLKVDKKINGNFVNNLWDAMQPVDLDECRLLVKQALEGAGYSAWEPLIKEEENETSL